MQDMLGGATGCYELLEFTMQEFPGNHSYLLGSGFVPAFLFFIPRSIWPDKPIASGGVITDLYYHTTTPTNNIPNTIVGEMYMNFGVFGVFFGLLLIGMIVRGINTFLRRESNSMVVWPAWLLIVPDFATEWRGDFTSITVQAFLRVSVFIGMAWLGAKVLKGRAGLAVRRPALYQQTGPRSPSGPSSGTLPALSDS
jgi:hypothetical protein